MSVIVIESVLCGLFLAVMVAEPLNRLVGAVRKYNLSRGKALAVNRMRLNRRINSYERVLYMEG